MITGASSGIGRGLAVELARRGAKVGLIARRADVLEEVIREVEGVGSKAVALPADVQDASSMAAAAEKLRAEFGPIHNDRERRNRTDEGCSGNQR